MNWSHAGLRPAAWLQASQIHKQCWLPTCLCIWLILQS